MPTSVAGRRRRRRWCWLFGHVRRFIVAATAFATIATTAATVVRVFCVVGGVSGVCVRKTGETIATDGAHAAGHVQRYMTDSVAVWCRREFRVNDVMYVLSVCVFACVFTPIQIRLLIFCYFFDLMLSVIDYC